MMNLKKLASLSLAAAMSLTLLSGCGGGTAPSGNSAAPGPDDKSPVGDPVVLRMSGGLSDSELENNPAGMAIAAFMDEIKEKTNGQYVVEFYGGGQLGGTTQEYVGGCQNGAFEMVQLSQSNFGGYTQAFVPLNIPFLFTTADCAFEFLRGSMVDEMIEMCEKDTNLRPLAFLPIGYRHMANNIRPILTPDDCKGVKFRTMSDPYQIAMIEAFGGSAMTLGYNEMYSALQQGLCDGQENPFMNLYGTKVYEVQKYLSTTGHQYTFTSIFINDDILNSFPEDVQQIFIEAGKNAQELSAKLAEEKSEEARGLMADSIEIVDLTPEQKDVFRAACAPVYDTVKSDIGEERYNAIMSEIERIEKELNIQ